MKNETTAEFKTSFGRWEDASEKLKQIKTIIDEFALKTPSNDIDDALIGMFGLVEDLINTNNSLVETIDAIKKNIDFALNTESATVDQAIKKLLDERTALLERAQ